MAQLCCPMCNMKFSTSKREGRIRCPECDELFDPDWDELQDREPKRKRHDDDNDDDDDDDLPSEVERPKRIRKRPRRGSGGTSTGLIVTGLIVFLLLAGAIGLGVWWYFSGSSSGDFATYSPEGGGCSLLLSGKPKAQKGKVLEMEVVSHSVGGYSVAWTDIPSNRPFNLREVVDGIARMTPTKATGSEEWAAAGRRRLLATALPYPA